jgi:hypothetical protein
VPARQLLDLTRDSGESPTSPVRISAVTSALPANPRDRPLITIPQDRPFGAARSGIFNHRLEEGRLNDIIDVLEKQKILTLLRRFRSYRGQGGLYPISSFVDASLHPVLFDYRDPTPEELVDDELFQSRLERYIPDMSFSDLKDLYKKKFYMRPNSDYFRNFQESWYLKYNFGMITFDF